MAYPYELTEAEKKLGAIPGKMARGPKLALPSLEDQQTAADKEALSRSFSLRNPLVAAGMDVATLPGRALFGATNTLLRAPRALGVNIPYIPESAFGGDSSSMTPYYDRLRASGEQATAATTPAPQVGGTGNAIIPLPGIAEYNNQGLPGSESDTRTAMGADSRKAPVLMRYGDEFGGQAIIEGTNALRPLTPARVNAPAAAPRTGPSVEGTYARFDPQTASQAAGYGAGGGSGVKGAFSAADIDSINERIRTRVAGGGANTFSGYGMPKTPEQQQYEAERLAQGTEAAQRIFSQAATIDAERAAAIEAEKAAMPSATPQTLAGALAQRGVERAQEADALRRREAAAKGLEAARQIEIQAQSQASSAALQGLQGLKIQGELGQQAQQDALQRELLSPTTSAERKRQIQEALHGVGGLEFEPVPVYNPETGMRVSTDVMSKRTGVISGQGASVGPTPLPNHVAALKANPALAAQFDEQYGAGTAEKVLGK